MRKFVLGDIHGAYKSLLECLKGVDFDYDNDKLIFLGDVCDGWSEVIECIEELNKIKNLISIVGNHDDWTLDYIKTQYAPIDWTSQGGDVTKRALDKNPDKVEMVRIFIEKSLEYYIDDYNNIFTHAGFNTNVDIKSQDRKTFLWSRSMVNDAGRGNTSSQSYYNPNNNYNKIYVGHTPTTRYFGDKPVKLSKNIIMMDTGAAFKGKLTIMDIDTEEIFQSIPYILYPNEDGRNN